MFNQYNTAWGPVVEDIYYKRGDHVFFHGTYTKSRGKTDREIAYGRIKNLMKNEFSYRYSLLGEKYQRHDFYDELKRKSEKYAKEEKKILKELLKNNQNISTNIDSIYNNEKTQNRVVFWTQIINRVLASGEIIKPLNEEECFFLLINSTEFINNFRGKDTTYSSLYSGKYQTAYGKSSKEEARKEIEEAILKKRLSTSFFMDIVEAFTNAYGVENMVENPIKSEISKIFQSIRKKKINTNNAYEEVKNTLKKKLEELMRQLNKENKFNLKPTKIEVRPGKNRKTAKTNSIYLIINIQTELEGGIYYQTKKGKKIADPDDIRIPIFINSISNTYKKIQTSIINKNDIFLTVGFKKIQIQDSSAFDKSIKNYIGISLRTVLLNVIKNNPTFLDQDWNRSVLTGLLGELSTYLRLVSNNQIFKNLKLTGTQQDSLNIKGTTFDYSSMTRTTQTRNLKLGESFADITFEIALSRKKTKQYGINVKNYISQTGENFMLYEASEGIGIFSNYIYKYFQPAEVKLMRYIESNKIFFRDKLQDEREIKDEWIALGYYNMAKKNITKFIRLNKFSSKIINLLYVINGIVIPASVIFLKILEVLENELQSKNLFEIIIDNSKNYTEPIVYNTTTDSQKKIGKSKQTYHTPGNAQQQTQFDKLSKSISNGNLINKNRTKIKFKGLNIGDLLKL